MKRPMNPESQVRLSEICAEASINSDYYLKIKDLIEEDSFKAWHAINDLRDQKYKLERSVENQQKIIKEQGERFKSKIMSAYYLMGSVAKMGTHREKETAIRFIQCTLDDIVKGQNDMSWDQDLFKDMPF